jgi:hypothetical protein
MLGALAEWNQGMKRGRADKKRGAMQHCIRPSMSSLKKRLGVIFGLGVAFAEPVYAACTVDKLLLAGIERMAGIANFNV